jgi:hypothetical protein
VSILVDYRCTACGALEERWAPSPPPATAACSSCGDVARRAWAAIGLSAGAAAEPATRTTAAAPATGTRRPLCNRFPQVPGLCHMSESAGRVWLAKFMKNGRAMDSELSRQESRFSSSAPTVSDAITHQHFSSA